MTKFFTPFSGLFQSESCIAGTTVIIGGLTRQGRDAINDLSYLMLEAHAHYVYSRLSNAVVLGGKVFEPLRLKIVIFPKMNVKDLFFVGDLNQIANAALLVRLLTTK